MDDARPPRAARPALADAEAAVETLIRWAGDDPAREGLRDTPARVAAAYGAFFRGYAEDPQAVLARSFEEVGGYDDIVVVRDIRLESHCEHHMVPMLGYAHIAYLPARRVVGISKLARLVDILGRRLQTQETLTAQVADAIEGALQPLGVAVAVRAQHLCMTTRGVHKPESWTVTRQLRGCLRDDATLRAETLALLRDPA